MNNVDYKKQLLDVIVLLSDGESDLLNKIQTLTTKEVVFLALFIEENLIDTDFTEEDKEKVYQEYNSALELLNKIKAGEIIEFTEKELRKITTATELDDQKNIQRILANCYRLLDSYDGGLCTTLADILEKIGEVKNNFVVLAEKNRLVYLKIYSLVAAIGFPAQKLSTQRGFLANVFVVLALRVGFDVIKNVAAFIRSNLTTLMRRSISLDFAASLSINQSKVDKLTVSEWIDRAKISAAGIFDNEALAEFYEKDPLFTVCLEFDQVIIRQIIDLYFSLINGEYIFEDEYIKKTMEMIREDRDNQETEDETVRHEMTFDEEILIHTKDFPVWIKERQALVKMFLWLRKYYNHDVAKNEFISLLAQTLPADFLDDENNLKAIMELDEMLERNGYGKKDESDLVSFYETDNKFHWNEELMK